MIDLLASTCRIQREKKIICLNFYLGIYIRCSICLPSISIHTWHSSYKVELSFRSKLSQKLQVSVKLFDKHAGFGHIILLTISHLDIFEKYIMFFKYPHKKSPKDLNQKNKRTMQLVHHVQSTFDRTQCLSLSSLTLSTT